MKKRRRIIFILTVSLALVTVAVGVYNHCSNTSFWNVNIAQILTLIITLAIVFVATQFKNDQRRAKDHAERMTLKIQELASSDCFYSFKSSEDIQNAKRTFYMSTRKISNCVEVLKKYGEDFGFKDDIDYLEKETINYKTFVSEHISNMEYLEESESQLRRYSANIDSKCDQIIAKLYQH